MWAKELLQVVLIPINLLGISTGKLVLETAEITLSLVSLSSVCGPEEEGINPVSSRNLIPTYTKS